MKYIAIAALFGSSEAYSLNQQKLFAQVRALDDSDYVQLGESKILEQGWDGIAADMHEFPGTVNEHGNFVDPYERVLPERFQGDAAENGPPVDKFTQNIIENFAIEGLDGKKEKDPKPTGQFYITKEAGNRLAREVICTHFKKCGDAGSEFLKYRYDEAWDYYDVNKEGKLDAVGMTPQFLRHLCLPLGWVDI